MPDLLRLDAIHAGYGGMPVLRGVGFALAPGETMAIVGANGAGKTTLLRAIMGEVAISAGSVWFAGKALAMLPMHARVRLGIGYCPEGRQLFPMMSVAENLELGAAAATRAERAARLERVLTIFPKLQRLRGRLCGVLSGGEQQMVAVGRALMGAPRLLLLDEPSTGLAPRVVQELYESLRALLGTGMAILVAEQNARAAMRFAAKTLVFEDGRIALAGASAALLNDRRVIDAYIRAGGPAPAAAGQGRV